LRSYNEKSIRHIVKIYTRTGDTGETALFGGTRVSKGDPRVEAYGEVDELNAWLGFAHATVSARPDSAAFADILVAVVQIQRDLFALGARLADPGDKISARVTKAALHDADVERLEHLIDRLEADLPPLAHFILAGGVEAGAVVHLARAVCRRAERRMVMLQPPVDPILIRYINRLSDLLFVIARSVNHRAGAPETKW
jgi:cob(I)alamin adenosyltransferase